jgi:hypothetical protein
MKDILEFIDNQKKSYAQLPLFEFMRDRSFDPRQRLGFAPCMAYFIMSFADLNKYVWRQEDTTDPYQDLINQHTHEDDHHWSWFLADLQKLDFDKQTSFVESLRFLWSDEVKITRQLSYRLAAYHAQITTCQKIAMIEAIEATGHVLFEHTNQVVSELQATSPQDYQYFGNFHLQMESGHTRGSSNPEHKIAKITLDSSEREDTLILVQNVFKLFTDWTEELLHFAKNQAIKEKNESANHEEFMKTQNLLYWIQQVSAY